MLRYTTSHYRTTTADYPYTTLRMPIQNIRCNRCRHYFANDQAYMNHHSIGHQQTGSTNPEPVFNYWCRHCGKGTRTGAGLTAHQSRVADCRIAQDAWTRELMLSDREGRTLCSSEPPSSDAEVRSEGSRDEYGQPSSSQSPAYIPNKGSRESLQGEAVLQDDNRHVSVANEDAGYRQDDDGSGSEGHTGSENSDNDDRRIDMDAPSDIGSNRSPSSPPPNHPDRSAHRARREGIPLEEWVDEHGHRIYIQAYGTTTVGEPIRRATPEELDRGQYPDVGQLKDPECFEIAQMLMESGMSGRFRQRCLLLARALGIEGDKGVEIVELWMRDALEIVKRLLRNKRLGRFMHFKPIKKWTSPRMEEQIRNEVWTGDWMWEIQAEIQDENGTVIPIIISSDETKLTTFSGDKKAHPVYLTIGNIPKRLRRRTSKHANILLGYLPVPKLDCQSDQELRRYQRRDLFHRCMRALLAPLAEAAKTGIEVPCANGGIRRIYPVLAAYIADFPEQCKIACIKQTHCPLCTAQPKKKGDLGNAPPRTHDDVIGAMEEHRSAGSANFERLGLYDIEPFWEGYPHIRLDCLMTPDLLHQMHKGVMKDHLTKWVTEILGKQVIDLRHTTMPEYHGMRHFKNGISSVSQWTGRELKEMAKVLLPVISDAKDDRVVTAARALLDFMYLSHSSSLSDSELDAMDKCLRTFHANKSVFKELGALKTKEAFHGIPKFHMIQHYTMLIRMLGTPDGFNTETSERLHINFAKIGYRRSNRVNAIKQMALYIQRMEALVMHEEYLQEIGRAQRHPIPLNMSVEEAEEIQDIDDEDWDEWLEDEDQDEDADELRDAGVRVNLTQLLDEFLGQNNQPQGHAWKEEEPEGDDQGPQRFHPAPLVVTAATPTDTLSIQVLQRSRNADQLLDSLLLCLRRESGVGIPTLRAEIPPTTKVGSWSRARLFHAPPPFKPSEGPHIDVIRAQPMKADRYDRVSRPARFDTVLVRVKDRMTNGIHSYRPARVRVIFQLPEKLHHIYDWKLAYVQMFNPVSQNPAAPTGLYTASRTLVAGRRSCAVIPLDDIAMTCHLVPHYRQFRPEVPLTQYADVLELCTTFYINIFATYFFYELLRHWGQHAAPV
ncbi:plasma membrane ATPase 4 [Ceratobasidium sp. AG-Ba]|nr:plasma membrane ATPase 4 [Ceratobasidium sp. AG-Ba]